jgi:hypothetical protein
MILDRCSERPKLNHLPDQDVDARAARAIGASAQRRNGQNRGTLIDPRPGGRRGLRPTRAQNAPNGDRPGIRPHSTPIARATGGAL